jgi:hypothetical protein
MSERPKTPELSIVDGGKPEGQAGQSRPEGLPGQKCLARRRVCACTHRFVKDERIVDRDLSVRMRPDYDRRKLGVCPSCGLVRELCGQPAVEGRYVCRFHGGKAGRKPMVPVIHALRDEDRDAVVASIEAKDENLTVEFHVVKHILDSVLTQYDPELADLDFAERAVALLDRVSSIGERRARLRLLVPPDLEKLKLDFGDPRVSLAIKEKMRDNYEKAIRGTVQLMIEAVRRDPKLLEGVIKLLPERLRNYIEVVSARPAQFQITLPNAQETPEQ